MPRLTAFSLLLILVALAGCAPSRPAPDTVPTVDLTRYAGTWFEIERFDHWFERGLVGVTANYTLQPDGRIAVLNSGYSKTLDGTVDTATATAWTVGPAKLKVRFFWPFAGDYWMRITGGRWLAPRIAATCGCSIARRIHPLSMSLL